MKKVILLSMMCLMAFSMQAQALANNGDYVDLGLPSGTLWKTKNEKGGFKTYDEAVAQFGGDLPTMEQWEELKGMCDWKWTSKGYEVTGTNGNSIFLPAAGGRECDGRVFNVGSDGSYWSSTPNGSDEAWRLGFMLGGDAGMCAYLRCFGYSVRLVKD